MMYDVTIINDSTQDGVRRTSFLTCAAVCSERIDVETEGDTVRRIQFTKGCQGNTQGIASLCAGMKIRDVIARLEDCKARGTSCPDQLARALKQLL